MGRLQGGADRVGADGTQAGTERVARSPITLDELRRLEQAAGLTAEDDRWLREAADVLREQAGEIVDAWRAAIAEHPHLAAYSAGPDGKPNQGYSRASRPRFARWIVDVCERPRSHRAARPSRARPAAAAARPVPGI